MKWPVLHSLKNIYSRGLVAAVFIFGFFVFSDFAFSRQTKQTVTQSAWVIRANVFTIKGFQFKSLSQKVYKVQTEASSLFPKVNLALFYNKRVAVILKLLRETTLPQMHFFVSPPIKTIAQSGKNVSSSVLA